MSNTVGDRGSVKELVRAIRKPVPKCMHVSEGEKPCVGCVDHERRQIMAAMGQLVLSNTENRLKIVDEGIAGCARAVCERCVLRGSGASSRSVEPSRVVQSHSSHGSRAAHVHMPR